MNQKVAIKVISSSPTFKVLDISGQAGDTLKKHKVNTPGLLLVRAGDITYTQNEITQQLSAGDCLDIPANVFHEVICTNDAKFFVVMSIQTKMRFKK